MTIFLSHRKEDKLCLTFSDRNIHKVIQGNALINSITLAAFIRGSLEPQRLLIQIWRSSVTDACKQSDKS